MFSPLAQGLLTDRYLDGIPQDSRVVSGQFFSKSFLAQENLERVRALANVARRRGQTLAQMALAWTLRDARVTSTIVGVSRIEQLEANLAALEQPEFTPEELAEIDQHAVEAGVNIWAGSSTT